MADQAGRLAYAHGSAFTTEPLEAYAARGRPVTCRSTTRRSTRCRAAPRRSRRRSSWPAPTTSRAASPSAGSSFARWGSYHGNTLGALDLSGRKPLRRPYEGWLGPVPARLGGLPVPGRTARARTPSAAPTSSPPSSTGRSTRPGPGTVAAFVAEPIVGATLAAVVPPDGYWPAIAEVCRRHGVLLIADEVMTGFGRTGRWFGLDHWGVRPDILVAAKGASSGYWPFGFVAASDEVHAAVTGGAGFVHGFTYSHAPVGAAVAREVLRILETRVARRGERREGRAAAGAARRPPSATTRRSARSAVAACWSGSSWSPTARPASRSRAPRASPRRSSAAARERGVLVYSGTGNANGVDGDTILLGPPFVVTDAELERIAAIAGGRRSRLPPRLAAGRRPRLTGTGSRSRGQPPLGGTHPAIVRSAGRWHHAGSTRDRARRGRSAGCSPPSEASAMFTAADQRQQATEPELPADPAAGRRHGPRR